jgi:hypothetical protein
MLLRLEQPERRLKVPFHPRSGTGLAAPLEAPAFCGGNLGGGGRMVSVSEANRAEALPVFTRRSALKC